MNVDHLAKLLTPNRQHALDSLPDRIVVSRPGSITIDKHGITVPGALVYPTWQGSTIIPCRFDASRSFRPDALRTQEVVANEHTLHVPNGLDIRPDDRIVLLQPVEIGTIGTFAAGLTGWGGPTSGATFQALGAGGVRLTFADTTTELLVQTVGTGLSGKKLLIESWAEVYTGTVQLITPAGTKTLTAVANGKAQVLGTHAGVVNTISFIATAQPAAAFIANFRAWKLNEQRYFEARKFTNASVLDLTMEILVTEMEFQHTDD